MFLIKLIMSGLFRLKPGMTEKTAKALSTAILVVLALVALAIGVYLIKKDAVDDYVREVRVQTAEDSLQSTNRSNENDEDRRKSREADHDEAEDRLEEIHESDPEGASAPASRGSRVVADRMSRATCTRDAPGGTIYTCRVPDGPRR